MGIANSKRVNDLGVYGEAGTLVRQNQTVAFREDVPMAEHVKTRFYTKLDYVPQESTNHSIVNFLARPHVVKTVEWTDMHILNDNLITVDPFVDVAKTINVYNKLVGHRYFKADVEFTLQVNAEPFQQGALLLWHVPIIPESKAWGSYRLATKTGFQSEVFNLIDAVSQKFVVPFTNPFNYIDLVDPPTFPLGAFHVTVYAPLEVGKVQVTLFAHFINVELYGPTDSILSASITPTTILRDAKFEPQIGEMLVNEYDPVKHSMQETMREVEEEEARNGIQGGVWDTEGETAENSGTVTNNRVVSKAAKLVAEVSEYVGDTFPVAKIVTTPLSWISTAVANIAYFFGWSKPISVAVPTIIKQKISRYVANYNGVDTSDNLGLDADNSIAQLPLFATQDDEMSFDHIITRLNYGARFDWSTTQDVGTNLFDKDVHPNMFDTSFTNTVGGKFEMLTMTHLSFVSHYFKYWNGEIKLQFRAFKTKFHSGRLRIIWSPGPRHISTHADSDNMCYSTVWNLQEQHTTSIVIPYMHAMPWLPVKPWAFTIASQEWPSNGHLRVEVLNKLVAVASVPQKFTIAVEIAGLKGFSFAVPVDPQMQLASDVAPVKFTGNVWPAAPVPLLEDGKFEPQIADDSGISEKDQYITQFKNKRYLLEPEKATIGEAIVSFRQLLKRFSYFRPLLAPGAAGYEEAVNAEAGVVLGATNSQVMRISPFTFSIPPPQFESDTTDTALHEIYSSDLVSGVAAIYAYFRGSMRLKCFFASGPTYTAIKLFTTSDDGLSIPKYRNSFLADNTATVFSSNNEGISEVQVPFYYMTTHILTKDNDQKYLTLPTTQVQYLTPGTVITTATEPNVFLYRAIGDDASFGYLCGVAAHQYVPPDYTKVWTV